MADKVICPVCEEECKEDEPEFNEFCSKCQKPAHCWCVVKTGETQICVLCYDRSKREEEEREISALRSSIFPTALPSSDIPPIYEEVRRVSKMVGKAVGKIDNLKADLIVKAKEITRENDGISADDIGHLSNYLT